MSTTLAAKFLPVSTTPAANFSTNFASVVDTGGKFATGVNDTGGKFATGVNDASGKLVHLELRISPRIFEKIRNGSFGILRGLGETDSCKKTEVENLVALSL